MIRQIYFVYVSKSVRYKKWLIQKWDNDGEFVSYEGYINCILPTIKYGNKFYRLNIYEDWEIKNSEYSIETT